MINVECPVCASGDAEVSDVAHDLLYLVIKCPDQCKKEYTIGLRDWKIDGESEL